MRIVLTGATGFIGNNVLKTVSKYHEVWCIVRKTSDVSDLLKQKCKLIYSDENDLLYTEIAGVKPELVILLAGRFLSEHSNNTIVDLLRSNIEFSSIIFDAAYEAGCREFINTASCWQNYCGENYNPVNLYAATKQAAEDILIYYVKAKKCKALSLQIFDSFGPSDKRNKVLNLVARLQDGEEINLSPGNQKLYLCYIEDIVTAYENAIELLKQMDNSEYHKYAVRDDLSYSLRDIVNKYIALSDKNIICHWGKRDYRDREMMDPDGIGEVLPGWKPKYTLEKGLKKYINDWGIK